MRFKKVLQSFHADLKRLFLVDDDSEKSPGTYSHGYMVAATKRSDSDFPRVIRSAKFSSASGEHREHEIYERLEKTVGTGSKGTVSLWRCRSTGNLVAVKMIRERLPFEPKAHYDKQVITEYNVGKVLSHGNVVRVLELLQIQCRWLQVMDYVPYDLYATVASRTMSLEESSCVFRQIVAGIEYVHANGFAHRDIKLDNIRLHQGGIVKIIDFGCAVHCESPVVRGMGSQGKKTLHVDDLYRIAILLIASPFNRDHRQRSIYCPRDVLAVRRRLRCQSTGRLVHGNNFLHND